MEARIRDLELELEEEKRRHAETIKILRKKERTVKEVLVQCEEDQKNVILLQETLEKSNAKINLYKRQLQEQVMHTFSYAYNVSTNQLKRISFFFLSKFVGFFFLQFFRKELLNSR